MKDAIQNLSKIKTFRKRWTYSILLFSTRFFIFKRPCETYFSKDGCKHFYKATKAMVDFAEQVKKMGYTVLQLQ